MRAATKRAQLLHYLAAANDRKVTALYSLLEDDINENNNAAFTQQELDIIDARSADLKSGVDKGADWQTMHDNIRKKKKVA